MRLSPGRAAGLAFLTAAVTLLLQILVHRMVSAKLLNNYAFLVISHTMLGFALSGVVLSFKLRSFLARLADAANLCAALLVVSLLVASIAFYHSEAQAHFGVSRPAFVVAFFRWMPYALLYALPFAFSGLTLGALLAAPELPARRIYFWDLLGSAVGAFAAIPAIQLLGVEWSTLALCAASLLGTLLLAPPPSRRVRVVLGATAAGLLAASCSRNGPSISITPRARCSRRRDIQTRALSSSTRSGTRSRASRCRASRLPIRRQCSFPL